MSGRSNISNTQGIYPSIKIASTAQYPLLHYMVASALFSLYGGQVCPLLESIAWWQLFIPIMLVYSLRSMLMKRINLLAYEQRIRAQFYVDLGLFLTAALGLVIVNLLLYSSPWHSNLKVLFGMSLLGIFVAVDLALIRERQQAHELVNTGESLAIKQQASSFVHRFTTLALVLVFSVALVLFLVVNKDLEWILQEGITLGAEKTRNSILQEFAFVTLVMLAYIITIIRHYALNMQMYLGFQNNVLSAVAEGNLQVRVPVASQDEFGTMAQGTNAMVSSLLTAQNNLRETRDATIVALASLAEARDNETGAHVLRTQHYVRVLAEHLSNHPDFTAILDPETIQLFYKTAPLHDIGKVGIPDHILLKPGKLTDDEFDIMRTHAQLGSDALDHAAESVSDNAFLRHAQDIAANHHEKWDGSGYPMGKQGEQIPLSARLMALADVYDALISKRVYKPAFSHDKAKSIIIEGQGSHFDPRVVDAFLSCEDAFVQIALTFKDNH
ncbi:HD domain-containing protein [Oceanospirillum multiglobuliferum]|nr:HD domain-containing phosphohydrolase [Oceanospirillum multiglobuliferum]SJZ98260.1 HD domain-containing protein [Oceanospirillum multiglobuliferum]